MRARWIGAAVAVLALGVLGGCAGKAKQLQMWDGAGAAKDVVFPKGRVFGGVSQQQVGALAEMVAASNTAASARLDAADQTAAQTAETAARIETGTREIRESGKRVEERTAQIAESGKRVEDATRQIGETARRIDGTTQKISETTGRVEESTRRIEDTTQRAQETGAKTYDTTRMILDAFEKVSKKQGTGEITIFFPVASSRIERGSLQYERVVNFADFLARESRGRKIMFVSVGSASAFGPQEINERLARERSEAPLEILDKYLVNLPHEYVKMYGTGDVYSPRDVTMKEHERYQTSRLIAFYEKGQEPPLPRETEPGTGPVSRR